jgi:class 3 adenylate cyclase
MDEVEEFLLGTRVGATASRRVVTVMFTDVVRSTERAAEVGDLRWHDLLEAYQAGVRSLVVRHGGVEVDTAGDGFLVAFESPSAAIRCARDISGSSRDACLEVRIGIHAGEVVRSHQRLIGLAVHIGARVGALADANEVLVSQTVRDLVIGSETDFVHRGRHTLKGVPGRWDLFAIE